MESGAVAVDGARPVAGLGDAPGDKGLKTGAISYISNVVIAVASTAPGYSLASNASDLARPVDSVTSESASGYGGGDGGQRVLG